MTPENHSALTQVVGLLNELTELDQTAMTELFLQETHLKNYGLVGHRLVEVGTLPAPVPSKKRSFRRRHILRPLSIVNAILRTVVPGSYRIMMKVCLKTEAVEGFELMTESQAGQYSQMQQELYGACA